MKAVSLGLLLSLMGGVAWAQTAASGTPASPPPAMPGAATTPMAQPSGASNAQTHAPGDQGADGGQAANGGPDDPYEGEIIETPNGSYMISGPQQNEDSMSEGQNDGMQGSGPEPGGRRGMRPNPHPGHRMPSKAAHFRIKGPDLTLDIKCPDEEPVKACVDAVSQLIDKANTPHH